MRHKTNKHKKINVPHISPRLKTALLLAVLSILFVFFYLPVDQRMRCHEIPVFQKPLKDEWNPLTDAIGAPNITTDLAPEPIDIVILWVNGSDVRQKELLRTWKARDPPINSNQLPEASQPASDNRFRELGEMRYALRSIEKFLPWARHVFIITNGQIPAWLDLGSPHISLITHEQIFANASHLPTFSSEAIQANIHRIPGLARKFIYMDDDMLFMRPIDYDVINHRTRGMLLPVSPFTYSCADNCHPSKFTDGLCHPECDIEYCQFSAGACLPPETRSEILHALYARDSFEFRPGHDSYFASYFHTQAMMLPVLGPLRDARGYQAMGHGPLPLDRTALEEMHEVFPELYDMASSHRFRHPYNTQFQYSYQLFVTADHSGRYPHYIPQTNPTAYHSLQAYPGQGNRLRQFYDAGYLFLCVNDALTGSGPAVARALDEAEAFYTSLLPRPSQFEKTASNAFLWVDKFVADAAMCAPRIKLVRVVALAAYAVAVAGVWAALRARARRPAQKKRQ
eukprot:gnl/Chilomastix_cuspidata/1363.p1 GENE.gnl/Chilomastix_cuspidata/1363~~gnl/Chilomastix_cuspidata/1363.p1  ORF type:complete len:512 (+),score=152.05 gnl/Chilomastix_cuspidata/1363:53-1588(+)